MRILEQASMTRGVAFRDCTCFGLKKESFSSWGEKNRLTSYMTRVTKERVTAAHFYMLSEGKLARFWYTYIFLVISRKVFIKNGINLLKF